ncbi:MAG: response regulator [Deltaproteobacteria bacterium]|nr:response regulator [Deltaproteobacteria bacterium]MBW2137051.1 response regulator [Deltaproteobacteria bacterium]
MPKKILIVDDDPDNVSIISLIVEDNGYESVSAYTGKEGLEMAKKEKPDLITLDLIMPEQSGITMFQELKKDPELCNIPVVIISGASEVTGVDLKNFIFKQPTVEDKKVVETEGITKFSSPNAFIEKPVNPDELVKTLKDLLKE